MAGALPRKPEDFLPGTGAKVALISSMWHPQCVQPMVKKAQSELIRVGVKAEDIQTHQIPGSLELPFAARALFQRYPELDAILAFGVVLQGMTIHDKTVIETVVRGFLEVSNEFGKPIINEVIGVSDLRFAVERSQDDEKNKGVEAAFAFLEIFNWLKQLRPAG